jgi:hypothetical protein
MGFLSYGYKALKGVGQAINKTKPNVPKSEIGKKLRDLKIATNKSKGSLAKLKQTAFEIKNNKPITFKKSTKKSESNKEAYKRIQKDNTKVIKSMLDKATEKKAMGGRIGYKSGTGKSGAGPAGSAKISDKADRAKKAFDMIQTNLNTDFKTMNRTQDSKGRFKDRKSMRKYIDDVSAASTRDSAKVRIDRRLGGGADMAKRKTNVQKIKETFAPKKPGNVPSKFKGFSKLPEAVQQKINKKLAKKV